MKLSIIIRCMNRLEYTIRTIVSIAEKSGLERDLYEIICVDQNSSDGTKEWLRSVVEDGYYPIRPLFLRENIGDGLGMQAGISIAGGEFIAQHDSDIEIVTKDYYQKLISLYETLEADGENICALSGSHVQGFSTDSAPFRFGQKRFPQKFIQEAYRYRHGMFDSGIAMLYYSAWVTASFIFRRRFTEIEFDKRMCNSWCGTWWDKGYVNFVCSDLKFWHIDSAEEGHLVQKQADKFPSYSYINIHYRNFIKE